MIGNKIRKSKNLKLLKTDWKEKTKIDVSKINKENLLFCPWFV
jgi:hypothetical protein